jgi:hypothetical protein
MRISPWVRAMLSRPEEILIHVDPLACPPTLQYRHLPRLPPDSTVERSPSPMPPLPQPSGWSLGDVPLPTRFQTLPLQNLRADIQRPDQDAVRPEPAISPALDYGDLSVMPGVFVPSHRQGVRPSCPHRLSLVLVAASRRLVLRDGSPPRGDDRSGRTRSHRWEYGASDTEGQKTLGTSAASSPEETRARPGP